MTTPNNEIVITESAMKKVLSSDETLRLYGSKVGRPPKKNGIKKRRPAKRRMR